MKEIRIYFECLEQAAHFILPLLERTGPFNKGMIKIKLIKLSGNSELYSKFVAPIVYVKNPDILITVVQNGNEFPLFQLEISTAVFTEDHELQRFDGIVASIENNCIYGKLSPLNKLSQSSHGGKTDFDFRTSYKAALQRYGRLAFHFDWPCDDDGAVVVDDDYLSCPKHIDSLTLFLTSLIEFVAANEFNSSTWLQTFEEELLKKELFAHWLDELGRFKLRDIKTLNSSRTLWNAERNELCLKINRLGHSMDPERGMLVYYGSICENIISQMVFDKDNNSWYNDTPQKNAIESRLADSGLETAHDYLDCFLLGSGLHGNQEFVKYIRSASHVTKSLIEIDLSEFLSRKFNLLNKALRTIFKFSKELQIFDTAGNMKVRFKWKNVDPSRDYSELASTTPIRTRSAFDEDDVTYICVHNVLKENGYKLIAVSYPGAQGDRVVLAEKGMGRTQQRRYIDIISYLPLRHTALQENKGIFHLKEIQTEIDELSRYRSEAGYRTSIEQFVDRYDRQAPKAFKIGVGFWSDSYFSITSAKEMRLINLDYFVYIAPDQREWKVFSADGEVLFTKAHGKVNLPTVYEVDEGSHTQQDLFEMGNKLE